MVAAVYKLAGASAPPVLYDNTRVNLLRAQWQEPSWDAQYPSKVAPLTLRYGDQPPKWSAAAFYNLRNQWPEPSWPAQSRGPVAPLTLTYGDQPPRYDLARLYNLRAQWSEPTWDAQSRPPIAAPIFVPSTVNNPPPRNTAALTEVLRQWIVTWDAQYPPKIAPLTLVYGDQPPPFSLAKIYNLRQQWPELDWPAQSESPNASWNIRRDNPPPRNTYGLNEILRQWVVTWDAQARAPTAAWNVPRVDNPPPRNTYGLQVILPQWEVTWGSQTRTPTVAEIFVPPAVGPLRLRMLTGLGI